MKSKTDNTFICSHCAEEKVPSNYDYNDDGMIICSECVDSLPNNTGYCSMQCRLGCGCDDSC